MGLGDDLMITGFVEREHEKHPKKQIVIGNLNDKNVEIYVKNSAVSNFDNTVSYLNGNNFIPIGFNNDIVLQLLVIFKRLNIAKRLY